MILSQAVLEHVNDLPGAFEALRRWLAPAGVMTHTLDFGSHGITDKWKSMGLSGVAVGAGCRQARFSSTAIVVRSPRASGPQLSRILYRAARCARGRQFSRSTRAPFAPSRTTTCDAGGVCGGVISD